jgi:hypothetical protein
VVAAVVVAVVVAVAVAVVAVVVAKQSGKRAALRTPQVQCEGDMTVIELNCVMQWRKCTELGLC